MASQLPTSPSALAVPGLSSRALRVLALAIALLTSLAVFTATAGAATKPKPKKAHKPPVVTTNADHARVAIPGAGRLGDLRLPGGEGRSTPLTCVELRGISRADGAGPALNVANASCRGDSASLLDTNAPSNGCENSPGSPHSGYRTAFPLHVNYTARRSLRGLIPDRAQGRAVGDADDRPTLLPVPGDDFGRLQQLDRAGGRAGRGSPPTSRASSAGPPITASSS